MADTLLAGIGDNSGDMDAATAIKENLTERHPDVVKRSAELSGMLARAPKEVDNEDDANKLSEAVRQCTAFIKIATETRVKEKEPYLAGGRAVDGFFTNLIDAVQKTKNALLSVRTAYDVAVERAARLAREEEARRAREEADRAAREAAEAAERGRAVAATAERAAVAEQRAEETQAAAKVTSAELTRTRTNTGVTTSLRSEWVGEIEDVKAVPRKFCQPVQGLINAAIKAAVNADGECPLTIKGVRIFKRHVSQVR
jgi:hypothetical protein